MRKIVYLIILLIIALGVTEYMRKYRQANVFVPSVMDQKIDNKSELSKSVGEYLAATISQRTGNYEKAIEYYEKAIVSNPDDVEIPKNLYGLYLYEGEYEKVLDLSNRNIEIDKIKGTKPKDMNPNPYLIVALNAFKNANYKKSIELLKPIANPDIQDKTHIDGVIIPLVLAWSYVAESEYKQAFDVIDNITTDYMLSVFSYNRAVINDIANGKYLNEDGSAKDIVETSTKLISDVFYEVGQYSLQSFNVDEAVIYFRLAKYLDQDNEKILTALAFSFEAKKEFDRSLKIYEKIETMGEAKKDIKISKALALHKLERDTEAIEILKTLVDDKGLGYKSSLAIGSIYMAQDNFEDAIKYFNLAESKIKDFNKGHWQVYFNLGISYDRIDNWEKSEESLKKAIQLFPENPEPLNYLAYSWIVKGKNISQAKAMLESAVIRSGGAPHILDSYGWALYKIGNFADATPFLEQAAISLPYNPIINDHLGDLYWSLGRFREAKYQWNKAVFYYDGEDDKNREINIDAIKGKIKNGKLSK